MACGPAYSGCRARWSSWDGLWGEWEADATEQFPPGMSMYSGGKPMPTREQVLDEVFEAALQNDMSYFG